MNTTEKVTGSFWLCLLEFSWHHLFSICYNCCHLLPTHSSSETVQNTMEIPPILTEQQEVDQMAVLPWENGGIEICWNKRDNHESNPAGCDPQADIANHWTYWHLFSGERKLCWLHKSFHLWVQCHTRYKYSDKFHLPHSYLSGNRESV